MSFAREVIGWLFGDEEDTEQRPRRIKKEYLDFLEKKVSFYRHLPEEEKRIFEQRLLLFLDTTEILGSDVEVTHEDALLVAASAIIPVWAFPDWHYFNLKTVVLVPGAFNTEAEHRKQDSTILGVVGNGKMTEKMIISKPALHHGFEVDNDKSNVGIHEFAHLLDMADGSLDGFPERLRAWGWSEPWFDLLRRKVQQMLDGKSGINPYGATNNAEFFSVASEYFFEQPELMKRKHPVLYQQLAGIYRMDLAGIEEDRKRRENRPCPCGSGRKYRDCCMPG